MDRSRIHFLRFLLEAYEGVGVLTTLDSQAGTVLLSIAPGREAEATELMADLSRRVTIEQIENP